MREFDSRIANEEVLDDVGKAGEDRCELIDLFVSAVKVGDVHILCGGSDASIVGRPAYLGQDGQGDRYTRLSAEKERCAISLHDRTRASLTSAGRPSSVAPVGIGPQYSMLGFMRSARVQARRCG
jgi:hypothetical protein